MFAPREHCQSKSVSKLLNSLDRSTHRPGLFHVGNIRLFLGYNQVSCALLNDTTLIFPNPRNRYVYLRRTAIDSGPETFPGRQGTETKPHTLHIHCSLLTVRPISYPLPTVLTGTRTISTPTAPALTLSISVPLDADTQRVHIHSPRRGHSAVSYTHLTLPTICSV